jgi:hypothetical protein
MLVNYYWRRASEAMSLKTRVRADVRGDHWTDSKNYCGQCGDEIPGGDILCNDCAAPKRLR